MLSGLSFIYFAPEKWDGLWRNRQQLMSVFARQNKVLFVEPRLHLRPTLTGFCQGHLHLSDLKRPLIRQITDNLFVFSYPVWTPISGQFWLKQLGRMARRSLLQWALDELQMSRPIVWLSRPDMGDLFDEVSSPCLWIYHVVDEYSAYSNQTAESRHRIVVQEKELMARVDMVIVVSKKLYEAKRPYHSNIYMVPNGVNYQAYMDALADPCLPREMKGISPPRLGYIGLIGEKLDLSMLKALAEENPHWALVFVGEARVSRQADVWQALQTLPNVHYLGPVTISQVPDYVKGFQVGLMPYLQNQHAENISPLKLYDYLAAGLPVASMDIPAAREFGPYIHLADTPQKFPEAVRVALADTTPERRQARRNVAAQHTWEGRVEQLSFVIQDQLTAKVHLSEAT